MKKKISPIKLHNLSEAEMETRELNLLRGGSGTDVKCPCISICLPENCTCMSAGLAHVLKEIDAGKNDTNLSDATWSMNSTVEKIKGSI